MEARLHLAGSVVGMMQSDLVLPSQHYGPRRKQAPEHRLMIAVLQDALECVEKHRFTTRGEGRLLFEETKLWFLSNGTEWPYSFECICGVLDLDADAVRQRLRLVPMPQRYPSRAVRPFANEQLATG